MLSSFILTAALLAQAPAPVVDQAAPKPPPPATKPAAPVQVSPWTDDRPITHFFQNFGKDLRALGSPETAFVLIAGGAAAGAVHPLDDNVATWVHDQPGTSTAADVGNAIGSGWTQDLGAVVVWAAGKGVHNDALAHIGSDLIRAQAVDSLLTGGLKIATQRTRPDGGSDSFPSGHTSATFATAAVIQSHFGWAAGAAGYGVASFVGWSRIRSDRHWLSDVVFGSAIGVVSGRSVARTHTSKWTVAPAKTQGGFAVYVTRR
jgi:membrane-associated phospholipid phosphatase